MLSVCSFITFFLFWNEIKEIKSYRIWKHLVVVLFFSLYHVAGVSTVSTWICSQWGLEGVGWVVGLYMCLHSHRHKQNRSEFSGHSVVRGEAQWKESLGRLRGYLCVKSVIGQVTRYGKHWPCDQIWAGEGPRVAPKGGWMKPPNKSPGSAAGMKHFSQTFPAQYAYRDWTVVPKNLSV